MGNDFSPAYRGPEIDLSFSVALSMSYILDRLIGEGSGAKDPLDNDAPPSTQSPEAKKPEESTTDSTVATETQAPSAAVSTTESDESAHVSRSEDVQSTIESISALAIATSTPPSKPLAPGEPVLPDAASPTVPVVKSNGASPSASSSSSSIAEPKKVEKPSARPPRVLVLFHGDETSSGTYN